MTSQRLLKLLAFLSLLATAAAVSIWRSTGMAPTAWLVRLSIGLFALALLVGLLGEETRPRVMLRFLSALFALIAVIALAADFSHAAAGFKSTSLMKHCNDLAPSLLNSIKTSILHSPAPFLWQPVLTRALAFPTYLIFAVLAFFAGFAGRPRSQIRIFVN
jgi:hypothetical protein